MAEYTGDVDGLGTLRLLDAIRTCGLERHVRFYQASTSELYGKVVETPQSEKTPFYPRSPYGVAKLYAYWIVVNYRESYDMYACNGILFNHESPRRGRTFVTRKISHAVAEISLGQMDCLYLGNIHSQRDWGHAKDYVEGMWLMLQQEQPEDCKWAAKRKSLLVTIGFCAGLIISLTLLRVLFPVVLATNETHYIKEYVDKAFDYVGIKLEWSGEGVDEIAKDVKTGKVVVRIDPAYFRPAEVELLWGDASKAERKLGWKRKCNFEDLVKEMVETDLQSLRNPVKDQN